MVEAGMPGRVLGWGYQGKDLDALIAFIHREAVSVVADVRLTPISRKRGFSKTALSTACVGAGARYLHLRALGNPKENRAGFWEPGTVACTNAHARFREEVLASAPAREQLQQIAELRDNGDTVALLCFEDDERCCHRALVADAVHSLRPIGV